MKKQQKTTQSKKIFPWRAFYYYKDIFEKSSKKRVSSKDSAVKKYKK